MRTPMCIDLAGRNGNGTASLVPGFTFHALPTVTGVTPASVTSLGGTSLTVHGSGFLNFSPGTNTLTFAGVTPSNLVVVDDATLACIAPAGANGTAADVVVSNGNGTGTLPAGLTYHALPATTAVTPDHGTPLGGTVVTLTGSGFSANGAGGNTITFDGVAATGIVVVDDSTVTCTAPADLHRRRVSG